MTQAAFSFTPTDIAAEGPDALQSLIDNAAAAVGGIGIRSPAWKATRLVDLWRRSALPAEEACAGVFAIIADIYAIGSSRAFWAARRAAA